MRAATARARARWRRRVGDAHAGGHGPVEERGFLEVADAVGVEGDVVVAEEHLAGDFGVDGVGVVEERRGEEGEAGVEGDPEQEDGEERGARAWRGGVAGIGISVAGTMEICRSTSEARHGAPDW